LGLEVFGGFMKKIELLFGELLDQHLGKDVFLVPYYLSKEMKASCTIRHLKTKNSTKKGAHRGVTFKSWPMFFPDHNRHIRELLNICYVVLFSKRIDMLMHFHFTLTTAIIVILYKFINPKGRMYIKGDGLGFLKNLFDHLPDEKLRDKCLKKIYKLCMQQVDYISIETEGNYQFIVSHKSELKLKNTPVLMPNGFDDEVKKSLNIKVNSFQEKENIILTVGRIGAYQKHTELLLSALEKLELKSWKVLIVGNIASDFEATKNQFFQTHVHLQDKVIFTGEICDKQQLWEYYNRAKVFILTSRWEETPNVFYEAQTFSNYLLTTNVNGAEEATESGKLGIVFSVKEQVLPELIATSLQSIIDSDAQVIKNSYPSLVANIPKVAWTKRIQTLVKKMVG